MANTHIITFIQHLSEIEIKIAGDYLSRSQGLFSDEKNEDSKELQLFRYIISNRSASISDQDILSNIGIKDLSHLKTHLYNKVLESLASDKYLTNSSVFNEFDTVALSLKKKLLIFKINLR